MSSFFILFIIFLQYGNYLIICENSNLINVQIVEYNSNKDDFNLNIENNPYFNSKYVLMSSSNRINGVYNYILLSDLYGPHFVLIQSEEPCKIFVNFTMLKNNNISKSMELLKEDSSEKCVITDNNFKLLKIEALVEHGNNSSITNAYNFDRNNLKIVNHTPITNNMTEFNLRLSNNNGTIMFDITFYGWNKTLIEPPNIPVGPLVILLKLQIENLNVTKTSILSLRSVVATSIQDQKFNKSVNMFFSDLQTPGVFRTYDITPTRTVPYETFSHFWKAVAYTEKTPRRASQIATILDTKYSCQNDSLKNINYSMVEMLNFIVYSYDCIQMDFMALSRDMNFFYTNYTQWSSTYGFISYYRNKTPIGIILLIAFGYGIPLLIGVVLCFVSRAIYRSRSEVQYTEIAHSDDIPTDYIQVETSDENQGLTL